MEVKQWEYAAGRSQKANGLVTEPQILIIQALPWVTSSPGITARGNHSPKVLTGKQENWQIYPLYDHWVKISFKFSSPLTLHCVTHTQTYTVQTGYKQWLLQLRLSQRYYLDPSLSKFTKTEAVIAAMRIKDVWLVPFNPGDVKKHLCLSLFSVSYMGSYLERVLILLALQ